MTFSVVAYNDRKSHLFLHLLKNGKRISISSLAGSDIPDIRDFYNTHSRLEKSLEVSSHFRGYVIFIKQYVKKSYQPQKV